MGKHEQSIAWLAELGARLREVRPGLLKQSAEERQRWFQGPSDCDLFLWYHAERGLTHLQLTLPHAAVEWSFGGPVRTARLASFGTLRHRDDQSRLVHDPVCDPRTLEEARVFLSRANVDEVTLLLVQRALGFATPS